jgi:drug/metabolite transporter (DMT)-like permease
VGAGVLVHLRMMIAAAVLFLYSTLVQQSRPVWRDTWKAFVILGVINAILPLTLEALAVVHLNASLAAILATSTPLFTALIAAVWLHERLTLVKSLGLMVGFVGVGVLVGWSPLPMTWTTLLAVSAALLSSALYAVGGIYAKVTFRNMAPLPLTLGQELAAGLVLLPFTLPIIPTTGWTLPVVAAMLTLALVVTAGGNVLYFYLIARIGPTQTQSVSFLVPVFALLAGVVVLDEPLATSLMLGLSIIFVSVLLVLEVRLSPRIWPARVAQSATQRIEGYGYAVRRWSVQRYRRISGGVTSSQPEHVHHAFGKSTILYDRHSTPARVSNQQPCPC